jgi:hypothetical protein
MPSQSITYIENAWKHSSPITPTKIAKSKYWLSQQIMVKYIICDLHWHNQLRMVILLLCLTLVFFFYR